MGSYDMGLSNFIAVPTNAWICNRWFSPTLKTDLPEVVLTILKKPAVYGQTVRTNPVKFLRRIALLEGISFLVLLGVAMPLKYLMGKPEAVKITGWIHGFLFMVFCVSLLQTMKLARWPFPRALGMFVVAMLPFGPFAMDRRLAEYQERYDSGSKG
jgi:integral membrane protein